MLAKEVGTHFIFDQIAPKTISYLGLQRTSQSLKRKKASRATTNVEEVLYRKSLELHSFQHVPATSTKSIRITGWTAFENFISIQSMHMYLKVD